MYRIALVLLAVSGCDIAFSLKHVSPEKSACGPFTKVTPVTINGVAEPRQFSTDGTFALVIAKDAIGATHPTILRSTGDAWEPDPTMQGNLGTFGIKSANLAPQEPTPNGAIYDGAIQPVLLGSSGTSQLAVNRYWWSGTSWGVDTNEPEFSIGGYDVYPGNVSVHADPGLESTNRIRNSVFWMLPQDTNQGASKIAITANVLPSFTLMDRGRTVGLNGLGLVFGQTVMTDDKAKLVYAAKAADNQDIFATAQDPESRDFDQAGVLVTGINTEDDEVEPWINADCTKMWFRRIPAETPNDAGQIFVAE